MCARLPWTFGVDGEDNLLPRIAPSQRCRYCTRFNVQLVAAVLTILGLVTGFILWNVAWTALAGAVALLLIEVYIRRGEGPRVLTKVDGELLVMIASLSIVIDGARLTGIPRYLYDLVDNKIPHTSMKYGDFNDVMLAMVFITILSNIVSNVPTVLLLAPMMEKSSPFGWLCLAWVSTAAGNLTLVGSMSNLLVAEKSEKEGEELTFMMHIKFAWWSTPIVVFVGCCILFFVCKPLFDLG